MTERAAASVPETVQASEFKSALESEPESASISSPTTVTRAVILAAGKGSKMWPYGVTQAKAALPVGAKPLLCHTLQVLHAVGVQEVGIVCGHLEHQLRHAASLVREGPAISWIRQPVPEGTAAALRHGSASGACARFPCGSANTKRAALRSRRGSKGTPRCGG